MNKAASDIKKYSEWLNPFNPFNSMKALLWRGHFEAILKGNFLPPVSVDIDPSNACNANCSWCIQAGYRGKTSKSNLSKETLLDLADNLGRWGIKGACIGGGGEPLMSNHVPDLIYALNKAGVQPALITNGILLEGSVCDALVKHARFTGISVDAGTADDWSKEKRTDRKYFDRIIDNIARLASLRDKRGSSLQIGYKMVIHPSNYGHIYEAVSLAKRIGANDFHLRPAYLKDQTIFTEEIISETLSQIARARKDFQNEAFRVYGITHKFDSVWKAKLNFKKCLATPLTATFGADGNLHICCDRRGQKGMILCKYQPFDEVLRSWGSQRHKKIIEGINLSHCPRCTFSAYNEMMEQVFIKDQMNMDFI